MYTNIQLINLTIYIHKIANRKNPIRCVGLKNSDLTSFNHRKSDKHVNQNSGEKLV
jgi:hypothetical protein